MEKRVIVLANRPIMLAFGLSWSPILNALIPPATQSDRGQINSTLEKLSTLRPVFDSGPVGTLTAKPSGSYAVVSISR